MRHENVSCSACESIPTGTPPVVKKKRESNIELCRIVCMLLIIAHHYVIHGGAYSMDSCLNQDISLLFVPFGKIAFDCFIMISAYFLVDQHFKAKKLATIWSIAFFYSVLFALIAFAYGASMNGRDLIGAFFPVIGNSHGFAAAYIVFYAMSPFLYILNKRITKKQLMILIFILIYIQVISKIFGSIIDYTQSLSSEVTLFVLIYFIASYLKQYPINLFTKTHLVFVLLGICFCYCCVVRKIAGDYDPFWTNLLCMMSNSESSPVNILAGILMFYLFKSFKINYNATINLVASTTFGILLIHDHNFFRSILWHNILHVEDYYHSTYFLLDLFVIVFIVFVSCMFIELLRKTYLEPMLTSNRHFNSMCSRMDNIINEKKEINEP